MNFPTFFNSFHLCSYFLKFLKKVLNKQVFHEILRLQQISIVIHPFNDVRQF